MGKVSSHCAPSDTRSLCFTVVQFLLFSFVYFAFLFVYFAFLFVSTTIVFCVRPNRVTPHPGKLVDQLHKLGS